MSSDRRIQLGFLLLAIVPLLLGYVTFRDAQRTVQSSRAVARANELVKQLEQLLSGLKDVEVAQREYILTGDEEYVRRMTASRDDVRAGVDRLENWARRRAGRNYSSRPSRRNSKKSKRLWSFDVPGILRPRRT